MQRRADERRFLQLPLARSRARTRPTVACATRILLVEEHGELGDAQRGLVSRSCGSALEGGRRLRLSHALRARVPRHSSRLSGRRDRTAAPPVEGLPLISKSAGLGDVGPSDDNSRSSEAAPCSGESSGVTRRCRACGQDRSWTFMGPCSRRTGLKYFLWSRSSSQGVRIYLRQRTDQTVIKLDTRESSGTTEGLEVSVTRPTMKRTLLAVPPISHAPSCRAEPELSATVAIFPIVAIAGAK